MISLHRLSHHPLVFIDLTYDRLGPVPGIVPIPLRRPRALPMIFPLPQQVIEPPFHIHNCIFFLPMDILCVHICARFAALGLVDGGGDLGPKFGSCLLQFFVCPLPECPPMPFPHPLHLLHFTLSHKSQLPPPPPLSLPSQNTASRCLLISWRPAIHFCNETSSIS